MNVRVDVLYWMDECLLSKRPILMCLAGKKKIREKKKQLTKPLEIEGFKHFVQAMHFA